MGYRQGIPLQRAVTVRTLTLRMDAIAHGVEARVERFDFHSRIVTEETVEVARQLGLPEQHIREWASARLKSGVERDKRIQWTVGGSEPSHARATARFCDAY